MAHSPLFQLIRKMLIFTFYWRPKRTKLHYIHFLLFQYPILGPAFLSILNIRHMLSTVYYEDIQEFAHFVGVLFLAITDALKVFLSQTQQFQLLIRKMLANEMEINRSPDDDVKRIHLENTNKLCPLLRLYIYTTCFAGILYTLSSCVLIVSYLDHPLCEDNSTSCRRLLVLDIYMPFDPYENYIAAVLFQQVFAWSTFCILGGDVFILTPIFYIICKLKVLQYVIRKFDVYARKDISVEKKDQEYYFVKMCIMEHQNIIKDFLELNELLKNFMLFDFLCHSLQIGCWVAVCMMPSSNNSLRCYMVAVCMSTFFQLFVIYWHGHELSEESKNLAMAIFESNWKESDIRTRRSLIIMIMRCQKPLQLEVGTFYYVNLQLYLKMIKAVYTYVTFFMDNQ